MRCALSAHATYTHARALSVRCGLARGTVETQTRPETAETLRGGADGFDHWAGLADGRADPVAGCACCRRQSIHSGCSEGKHPSGISCSESRQQQSGSDPLHARAHNRRHRHAHARTCAQICTRARTHTRARTATDTRTRSINHCLVPARPKKWTPRGPQTARTHRSALVRARHDAGSGAGRKRPEPDLGVAVEEALGNRRQLAQLIRKRVVRQRVR
jgi:hypothetical protein